MKQVAIFSLLILFFVSCEKEDDEPTNPATCDVRGTYTGITTRSTGQTTTFDYQLRDNNFVVGNSLAGSASTTYGGYRNTCDSVIISVYFNSTPSFYLLKAALSNNRTVISGTYLNLTTPTDFGTFTATKQ